jgi:hypothetical protein
MFTSIANRAGVLLTAMLVLTGGAVARGVPASADPNQDEQFRALLETADIPSQANMTSLIATARKVCRKLDDGMPVDALVDTTRNNAYNLDPSLRLASARRLTSTMTRFITGAVEAYCPGNQPKLAAGMASPAAYTASDGIDMPAVGQEPTGGGVVRPPVLVSLIGPVPAGEITPNPQIPPPPPPTAQIKTPQPPWSIATPHQPKQAPPPPKQPSPPPQQPPPPAAAPHPGGAAGSGGGGGSAGPGGPVGPGGAGPVEPAPQPPMPPGVVRLAP